MNILAEQIAGTIMPRINPEYRDDAKKKIIAAALEIANETGWNTVTLEAVARKVGVTKGALYTYFENSDALMDEVTFELSKKLGDNLMIDESGKDVDVHELLENVADLIFNDKKQVAAIFMQALTRTAENAQFREKVAVEYDENLVKFHKIFSSVQKSGQIPADVDITEAFKAIYGLTMGLAFIYHMLEKDHREAKKIWIDSAERILMLRPGAAR